MTCRKGHSIDEVGRAPNGYCRQCYRDSDKRFRVTPKAKVNSRRYAQSAKGRASHALRDSRYLSTAKGQLNTIKHIATRRAAA